MRRLNLPGAWLVIAGDDRIAHLRGFFLLIMPDLAWACARTVWILRAAREPGI